MADEEQPAAPAAGTYDPATLNTIIQQLMQQPAPPQPVAQPSSTEGRGALSLLGEALGGGEQYGTTQQREAAGLRALQSMGMNMMANSGYAPVRTPFGQILASGMQGAQQSLGESQSVEAAQTAAQQQYSEKQQEMNLQRIKVALPLLQLQGRQGLPSPFAQGGGGAAPGTSIAQGGSIGGNTYEAAIGGHEGLGADSRSNAVGGFIPSTWQAFAAANPDLFKGMSPDQVAAARSDPKLNAAGITWVAQQNAGELTKSGVTPSGTSLGIAHYLGAGPAAKVMGAPDNAPVSSFVSDAAVKANPELATLTVGQLKQRYANVPAPGFLTPPAPYKVASTGAIPPPPSSGPTAPATATPAADDTFFPNAPAPQQTSQADQPPAPPPVTTPPPAAPLDIKSAPDTTLNPEQYILKHWTPLSPEEVGRYAPGPENQLAVDRARQVQQAQADAAAARQTYLNVQSGRVPGDLNKSLSDMNTADARADAAEKDYNTAVQGLKTEGAKNLLAADDQQRQQLRTDFKSTVLDPAAQAREQAQTAAEKEKDRQNQIAIETLKGKQAIQQAGVTSDIQAGQKALEAVNATRDGARDTVNNLEVAKNFSKLAGTSGFLQQWPQVSNFLIRNNLLTSDEVQQMGAQKGLDAVMNKVILSMRAGSGMSRMTNFDLQFLQNTAPSSFTPEQMRPAMFAAIQTAASRQVEYADRVNELHASGMPVWQARQQADEDLGHMVKEVPTVFPKDDPRAGQPMSVDDQNKWIIRKVTPGTFYVRPDGNLAIRGEPKQGQQ